MVGRAAVVAPDDDPLVAEDPVGSHRRLEAGVAAGMEEVQAIVDAVTVDVALGHLVDVVEEQLVLATAADVAQLEGGVAQDLVLEAEVPLPGVRDDRVWIS